MKAIAIIITLFLFFFGMSMFGAYIHLDSFAAIELTHFITSCMVGICGLLFSALVCAFF